MKLIKTIDTVISVSALVDIKSVYWWKTGGFRKSWHIAINFNDEKESIEFWWDNKQDCLTLYDGVINYLESV
jgi:hypothetical protein